MSPYEQPPQWSTAPRMNELEAMMWRSEQHPRQSSMLTAVMMLDRAPEWARLIEAHEWATQVIGRSRQRVLEPAVPVGLPAWIPDENFDLSHHLRRAQLPCGGAQDSIIRFAQDFAMQPLDRTRPLWEAVLVQDQSGENTAYILKMHHSLTDGIGGIQLLTAVQSDTREHTPNKPVPAPEQTDNPSNSWHLAFDEVAEQARAVPAAAHALAAAGIGATRTPLTSLTRTLRYARSLRRVLSPAASGSPLLAGRTGLRWRFGTLECPLAQLRDAAKQVGGSVNDAFIAALLGGLRRYHDSHGQPVNELPVAMPVSLRQPDDPLGGNKFTGAMFAAPVALTDPGARICALGDIVAELREEPALDTFSVLAPVLNRTPSALAIGAGRLGGRADLSASNFRGQTRDSYLAGTKVERFYPFGPLPGVAVMATMISHVGMCCIGLNIDGAAVPDHDHLVDCFAEGLNEVLALSVSGGER